MGFLKKLTSDEGKNAQMDEGKNAQMDHIWPEIAGKDPIAKNSKK